jgi:chromosome segregation ATPase
MRNETEGRLENARSRTADLERQLAEVQAERAHWDGKGEAAEKHLGEVQALLDARTARREAAEAIHADRVEADAAKATFEADVATLQSELDLQNQILAKEHDKAEAIQKQVQATDALHAERCSAALKEELAEMIQHVHDTERLAKDLRESDPPLEQLEEDLAATQELVAKCKASAKAALDELRGQKARVDDARSALDRRRESLARLHELRSHKAQLEEEVAALQRSVDEQNRLAEAREEKRFQLRVYREAVKLLQDTAAKEEQALAVTAVPPLSAENESAGERLEVSEPSDPPGGGDPKDSEDPHPSVRLRMW